MLVFRTVAEGTSPQVTLTLKEGSDEFVTIPRTGEGMDCAIHFLE